MNWKQSTYNFPIMMDYVAADSSLHFTPILFIKLSSSPPGLDLLSFSPPRHFDLTNVL